MKLRIQFNNDQLKLVADIFKDVGLFLFGTVIAPLFVKFDINYIPVVVLGLLSSVILFALALLTLKRRKK